jgi:hypothetical protein
MGLDLSASTGHQQSGSRFLGRRQGIAREEDAARRLPRNDTLERADTGSQFIPSPACGRGWRGDEPGEGPYCSIPYRCSLRYSVDGSMPRTSAARVLLPPSENSTQWM